MVSYLRRCCTAIHKLRQKSQFLGQDSVGEAIDDSYSHLLQALCHHSPKWWKYYWISDVGILKSDDPSIGKLLQPLESFIQLYMCKDSNN